jgi:hypothetical protein
MQSIKELQQAESAPLFKAALKRKQRRDAFRNAGIVVLVIGVIASVAVNPFSKKSSLFHCSCLL